MRVLILSGPIGGGGVRCLVILSWTNLRPFAPVCESTAAPLMYIIMYTDGMKVMTMSESRANYAATLDAVIDDQEEVLITRPGGEGVVMVSQREYESMRETLYLMASPANRRRLSEAVARLEAGGGTVRELADEDTTA